jgi:hypothetical protein
VAQGNYYRDHIHTEAFTQSLKTAIDQRSTQWAPTPVLPTQGSAGPPPAASPPVN